MYTLDTKAFALVALISIMNGTVAPTWADEEHPLSAKRQAELKKQFADQLESANQLIEQDAESVRAYSLRGDAYFFRGEFAKAVTDYDRMVELDPDLDTSHWRRGIAYFYAGQFDKAARQFEVYHTFDNVDRENGIWRFFSQAKASGFDKAREGLLKYEKDDREPFPSVYKLFAEKITPSEILKQIEQAEIDAAEREKRFYYAQLYIGLNYALRDQSEPAMKHLRQAVENEWGPQGGYGPRYMWHVGRLHYERLVAQKQKQNRDAAESKE